MQKFEFVLKNDKVKQYDRFALFIIIINFALFCFLLINAGEKKIRVASAIATVLIIIVLLIDYFLERIKNNIDAPYRFAGLYIAAFAWMQMDNWWAAVLCFVIAILYQLSRKPLAVTVDTEKIVYTSFPKKNITWGQLNNVILKDGLLTVDLKNNKILQSEISNLQKEAGEKEFNDFCQTQLRSAN